MHSHAERGNDQGEAGNVTVLEENSVAAAGNIIGGFEQGSFPRSAWECSP